MEIPKYEEILALSRKSNDIINEILTTLIVRDESLLKSVRFAQDMENLSKIREISRDARDKRLKPIILLKIVIECSEKAINLIENFTTLSESDFSDIQYRIEELHINLSTVSAIYSNISTKQSPPDDTLEYTLLDDNYSEADDIKNALSNANFIAEANQKHFTKAILELQAEAKPLNERYTAAISYFDKIAPELDKKSAKLDELLGMAGQKIIAGGYAEQAATEKSAANWLRRAAIVAMLIAISPVLLSLLESSKGSFNIEQALLRLGYSILLSVPAAYLARESSKHRQQQYAMQQTALDVGSIGAYIKPLPDEARHRITELIATKLFSPKDFDHVTKESYPLNAQELITKLIDVAVEQREKQKSEAATKGGDAA